MNLDAILPILLVVFCLWLVGLTVVFYLMVRHYSRLVGNEKSANLKKVLDKILASEDSNKTELKRVTSEIARIDSENVYNIQKVGLVKFNPFNETGGDHSFSLSVLDGTNSGIVLTGLHTRERTRFYIKEIKAGKSNLDLSKEEVKALKQASIKKN